MKYSFLGMLVFIKCKWTYLNLRYLISLYFDVFYEETYRNKNKPNTTPIITITQVPSVPPIITGKLPDEENDGIYFLVSVETVKQRIAISLYPLIIANQTDLS